MARKAGMKVVGTPLSGVDTLRIECAGCGLATAHHKRGKKMVCSNCGYEVAIEAKKAKEPKPEEA